MARGVLSQMKEKTDTMSAYLPYESVYYEKIADYYKIAKKAVLFVLAAFALIVLIFFNRDLRAENIRYLFKYIDSNPISTSSNYKDIYYDSNDKTFFAFYKGDLAVIGDGKFKLYMVSGNNIMDSKLDIENPICDANGKYIALYSPGSTGFALFNSFSCVYNTNYNYPVISASSGKSGDFAVITRSERYRSVVYFYNKAFKNVYTWNSNEKYAASASVSPNGKNASLLSYSQSGGAYSVSLSVFNIGKKEQVFSYDREGGLPIKTGFFENNGFYTLCSDKIEIYNKKFDKIHSAEIEDSLLFYKQLSDGLIVITGENLSSPTVRYYNMNGEEKICPNLERLIIDADTVNKDIYLLTDSRIYLCGEKSICYADISAGANKIFVFDDGNAMICYDDHTQLILKDNFKEIELKGE